MAQMIEHMANDELVGWGLGTERRRRGTQKEFGELIKAWADGGAHCPS